MQISRRWTATIALLTAASIASATSALAQTTEVTGTGNPSVDVPAIQAAVNLGGEVVLRGHFSFDTPPTMPTALQVAGFPEATVLISKAVSISGARADGDGAATIDAGTIPFYVDAPGASVTIQKLRFVRPANAGVLVYSVTGLVIASCRIEGITPRPNAPIVQFSGITLYGSDMAVIPTPTQPGHPQNISGRIVIADNNLDLTGGAATDNVLGITTFSVGLSPSNEVDMYISGNTITNVTEPAINMRRIGGSAHVERNLITTGPVSSQTSPRPEAIRAANIGTYVIADNVIRSEWPDPDAIGIGVFSQFAAWPVTGAVVVKNEVTMSPPEGVVFGNYSAGIDIRGFVQGNEIGDNTVRGHARTGVGVDVFNGGTPTDTALVLNRFDDFEPAIADVVVDSGVTDTLILGQKGTVNDQGINTQILPF
ncbi:MAG TPA: hypothetical protein VFA99_15320 [Acidobacteriaceae bacterium]|nr:hypothetical protein [Acidobacteriaceae bacterium]